MEIFTLMVMVFILPFAIEIFFAFKKSDLDHNLPCFFADRNIRHNMPAFLHAKFNPGGIGLLLPINNPGKTIRA